MTNTITRLRAAHDLAICAGSSAVPINTQAVTDILAHIDAREARHAEELLAYEVTVGNLRAPREQSQPVAWIIPERDGEFHHEHASITAYRMPMPGWVPVYLHPAAPQAQLERKRCEYCDGTGDVTSIDGEWLGACSVCNLAQPERKPERDRAEEMRAEFHEEMRRDAFGDRA